MVSRGCRVLVAISAVAGASVLGLTSMTGPAFAADTALILGGSGIPVPPQSYVDAVDNLYLAPNGYGAYTPVPLTTPEQWYPVTGVNSLPVDTSVAQGVTILDGAIRSQIAAGNHVVVFGYSQGAGVASQEAANLASSSNPPSTDQLSFVLVGDPVTPNGGLITRFQVPGAPLSLPSLGVTFNTAPTTGSPYPTIVYNQEYDLVGDAPQYPLNFLSDLNAYLGFFTQHAGYTNLTPQQISSAVLLPTTGGTTQYYMVRTPNLPLLAPVRLLPLIGNPLADLLQPDLAVLVNLGYGSITNGWSPGPANVATPIGLFPTNINPADVLTALANGIPQGITNALNDLKTPQLIDLSPLSLFLAGANTAGLTPSATPSLLQLLGGFAVLGNTGTPVTPANIGSSLLTLPKPLADTVTTLVSSLPQYDAQLFTSQLAAGDPINAVGLPIAADLGLAPFALIFGTVFPVVTSVATTLTQVAQLTGLAPNPLAAPVTAAPVAAASTKPVAAASTKPVAAASTAINTAPAVSTNAGVSTTGIHAPAPATPAPATPSAATLPPTGLSAPAKTPLSTAPKAPSTPAPTGGLGTAFTGSGVHAPAVSAGAGAGVGGGTGVTGTSGSSGRTDRTAGTGLHRAHS
jgi:PE-PPE domain